MATAGSLWARAESWLTWTLVTESADGRLRSGERVPAVKIVMLRTVITSAERKRYLRGGSVKREMMRRLRI